jgi:hypothetical protein
MPTHSVDKVAGSIVEFACKEWPVLVVYLHELVSSIVSLQTSLCISARRNKFYLAQLEEIEFSRVKSVRKGPDLQPQFFSCF